MCVKSGNRKKTEKTSKKTNSENAECSFRKGTRDEV